MANLSKEELAAATDDKILEEFDTARRSVSYYNAAEGNYFAETNQRNAAYSYMHLVGEEITKRKLNPNKGEFLL